MLEQVVEELRQLGLAAKIVDFPNFSASPQAIIIDIDVENGRYRGQKLNIGISFQEQAYPEYPPHFIHLKSSVQTNITTRHCGHEFEGEEWSAYSLPPNDFWDRLETSKKNMHTYYRRHLQRVFNQL